MDFRSDDGVTRRMAILHQRAQEMRDHDFYFYNQPIEELLGGSKVIVNGREMGMFASYSYLGLVGHPRINAAAKAAVFHGVSADAFRRHYAPICDHIDTDNRIGKFVFGVSRMLQRSAFARRAFSRVSRWRAAFLSRSPSRGATWARATFTPLNVPQKPGPFNPAAGLLIFAVLIMMTLATDIRDDEPYRAQPSGYFLQ